MIIAYSFLFIFGLCIGSFLNAFQYREQRNITLQGRSFCPNCKHKLSWYDLIPIASWVTLAGKCRYCKKKISFQYPLIELITGFLFLALGVKSGLVDQLQSQIVSSNMGWGLFYVAFQLILLLAITTLLIIIALHDAKTGYILSSLAYLGVIISVLYLTLSYNGAANIREIMFFFLPYILSGVVLAGLFLSITLLSKEKWMGAGDAEIALFMGIFLGWPKILCAFYIALFAGIFVAGIKLLMKRATLKSEIPFGPFLVFGTFVAYLFADNLFYLYAKIFLGA